MRSALQKKTVSNLGQASALGAKQPQAQSAVSVKVIVRCRPFIEREIKAGEEKRAAVAIDKDLR